MIEGSFHRESHLLNPLPATLFFVVVVVVVVVPVVVFCGQTNIWTKERLTGDIPAVFGQGSDGAEISEVIRSAVHAGFALSLGQRDAYHADVLVKLTRRLKSATRFGHAHTDQRAEKGHGWSPVVGEEIGSRKLFLEFRVDLGMAENSWEDLSHARLE